MGSRTVWAVPLARRTIATDDPQVQRGLDQIARDIGAPEQFPPEVVEAATQLSDSRIDGRADRRDLPFVTIDPPGSTDLDQALHIERDSDGYVVWYAIADVAAFVTPGDPIDVESHERGVTLYAPDRRFPLHPPQLSEGVGSLLPGQDRPAVLWRLALDPDGQLVETTVERGMVRSREQLTYEDAQARIDSGDQELVLLRDVGERRRAIERERGGLSLPVPDQEVIAHNGRYHLRYRANLPVEGWNAQISLLCGMAAAEVMLEGGWGLLRTLPPATDESLAVLRRHAKALEVPWAPDEPYSEVVARLDTTDPDHAAFAVQSTLLFRGAGYLPLRPGEVAEEPMTLHAAIAAPYAHVTAPLRRMGDRYATEAVLAITEGHDPPPWVVDAVDAIPGELAAGSDRARNLDRSTVDFFETLVLAQSAGETFDAIVVDHGRHGSELQLREPAVMATVPGEYPLGDEVQVRVVTAQVPSSERGDKDGTPRAVLEVV